MDGTGLGRLDHLEPAPMKDGYIVYYKEYSKGELNTDTEHYYNKVMTTTIKTIDGELVEINENWKDVWGLPFNEKWVECPTLVDENEHLWVDESVLD